MEFLPALASAVKGKPLSSLVFGKDSVKDLATPSSSSSASKSSGNEVKHVKENTDSSTGASTEAANNNSTNDGVITRKPEVVTPIIVSSRVQMVYDLLEKIDSLIALAPPLTAPSRFGNAAFRTFIATLTDRLSGYIDELLIPSSATTSASTSSKLSSVTSEQRLALQSYLLASFGDSRRLDYGTGHELNFMCFLYSLVKLNVLLECDYDAIVLAVFARYITLVRRLLTTYSLEPAGSRGVWGLDDYHFLLYYLGAAQLMGHKHLKPKSARYAEIYEHFGKDWLYLGAIAFVNQVSLYSIPYLVCLSACPMFLVQ
jgi:hypothetical protein